MHCFNRKPGFTAEAFKVLVNRVHEGPVYCNLVIDKNIYKTLFRSRYQNRIYTDISIWEQILFMMVMTSQLLRMFF